ncbi:uncharacterized protein [Temnothorax longispinosus]|uniref:uncharacterized protein isoform X16 n=1 Tax=Temnothorax longispinosus TaxID=300112 RepID=UPI003A9A4530
MDVEEGEAKMCRLCGQYEKICIDVFGEDGVRRYLGTKIHEKINILIHKDDALPQQICTSCVNKLDFVCNFYDSCHVIQERLLWLIESSKNRRQEIQPADYQTNKGDDPTQEGVTLGTEYSIEYSTIIIKEECLPDLNLKLYSLNQETQPASCQTNKEDDPTQEEVTLDTKYSTEYSNSINKKECLPDLNLDVYPSNRETQPANCQTNKEDDPMQEGVTLATEYSTEHSNLIIKEECLPDLNLVVYPSSQETKKQSASYQMNKGDNPMQSHLESKFTCPKCPNVYKSKQSLNEHLLKHESIKKSDSESKFKCLKCPNVYKRKQNLNEHMLKHEDIKKHPIQQIPQNNLQQNNAQSLQRDNMPRRTDVKPRGRMTAYTYFVKSCHQEHKKKHPKRKIFPQFFSKNCGKRWKTMSDIEKKRFHEMAEKDKKRYDTEMQNYTPPKGKNKDIEKKRFHEMAEKNKKRYDTEMQNHTPKGENKGRGKKRKHIKDHNAPKRSLSAFFWFCNDERGKVKMLNPEYGMGDIAKELGKKWSNADPETISKYVAMAEKDKARYERERRNAYKKKIQNNGAPVVETITISDSEWEEWEDVEDDDE